jgi:hypothetical protein
MTSALGQKRTWWGEFTMSALPPKADIAGRELNVRFVPKADIAPGQSINLSTRERSEYGLVRPSALARLARLPYSPIGICPALPLRSRFIPRVNRLPNSPVDSRREQRRW